MDALRALNTMSWGRVGIGAGLLLMPGRSARAWLGLPVDAAGAKAGVRAIGGRDLALAIGLLRAGRRKEPLTGWIAGAALADTTDAAATLLSYPHLPRSTRLPILLSAAATAAAEVALGIVLHGSRPSRGEGQQAGGGAARFIRRMRAARR